MTVALAAEKRLVSVRFLHLARAAFQDAMSLLASGAAAPMDEKSLPPPPDGVTYTGRYEVGTPFAAAMDELSKCYDEVVILGGSEIGTQATAVISAISGYGCGLRDVWAVHQALGDLSSAMHEDATRPGLPDPTARSG